MAGNRNNNRNSPNNNEPQSKKSGAIYSRIKQGNFVDYYICNAWNKSKSRGMLTAVVSPYKESSKTVKNAKGSAEYVKMIAKVNYHNSGVEKIIPCLMNIETQVIVLSEIGMVITPNGSGVTSSGKRVSGYFGTMFK